jgi:hypothetical protein
MAVTGQFLMSLDTGSLQQGVGPVDRLIGHAKWLVAALANRRSHF